MEFRTFTDEVYTIFANNFVVEGDSPKALTNNRLIDIVRAFLGGEFFPVPSVAFNPLKLETAFYVLDFYSIDGEDCFNTIAYFLPGNLVYVAFENGEVITVIKK